MIARAGSGWQYALADLSLILFLVTASAVGAGREVAEPARPSSRSEPLAVWRAEPGAPALADWLASQPRDPRQQLTILAHYAPGGVDQALAVARALAEQAGRAGLSPRVVIEPGTAPMAATLAFDDPLARGLLEEDQYRPASGDRP